MLTLMQRIAACSMTAAVAAAGPAPTAPQDAPTTPTPHPAATTSVQPARMQPQEKLIDLDFRGGTIDEYLEAVRHAARPEPVNVIKPVGKGALSNITLPPMSFKQVTISGAIEAIEWATSNAGPDRVGVQPIHTNGGAPIYCIVRASGRTSTGTQEQTTVFMIRDMIEVPPGVPEEPSLAMNAESILSAIDTIISVDTSDGAPKPQVRFHPETGTLIIRASRQQLQAISQLLQQIGGDLTNRRKQAANVQAEHEARVAAEAAREAHKPSPAAGPAAYDMHDMPDLVPDMINLANALHALAGGGGLPNVEAHEDGTLTIIATPAQHAVLRAAFEAIHHAAARQQR